jgi:lactoylglutathione lyase
MGTIRQDSQKTTHEHRELFRWHRRPAPPAAAPAGEGGAGDDEVGGCALEDDPAAVVAGAGAEVDGAAADTFGAMKLAQTILYVQDVDQAAAFYERVFRLARGEVNAEGVYIALKTGETTLAFADAAWVAANGIDFAPVRPRAQPPGIEISLVEDVEATYRAAIEAGASAWHEPVTKPWGQTISCVRDPNGFIVEISSPPPAR